MPLSELQLYLEVPLVEGRPLHQRAPDEFLLFFKLYDPAKQRLSYLGSFYARKAQKLPDLVPMLNKMAGFPEGTALEVSSTCSLRAEKHEQVCCIIMQCIDVRG